MYSHRYALPILNTDRDFAEIWLEVQEVIHNISETQLINHFNAKGDRRGKSISSTINELLKIGFVNKGWRSESPIFQNSQYEGDTWRLDFAKENISIEVAFNHGSAIAWNLLKPVLASELNHVEKAIQTKVGIIICATEAMRVNGGFDSAVGTYEKFLKYLPPLNNQLSVPLLVIGLEAPKTFSITHVKEPNRPKIGVIYKIINYSID